MSLIVTFSEEQKERMRKLSRFGPPQEVIVKGLAILDIFDQALNSDSNSRLAIIVDEEIKKVITGL